MCATLSEPKVIMKKVMRRYWRKIDSRSDEQEIQSSSEMDDTNKLAVMKKPRKRG